MQASWETLKIFLFFFSFFFVGSVLGQEPLESPVPVAFKSIFGKRVGHLEIEGLKRIEKEAVLNKITLKVGSIVTAEQIKEDIRSLFAMGYFDAISVQSDPQISLEASQLNGCPSVKIVYVLRERPVISKIEFKGNEHLSSSDLKEVIKVKEWSILDINKVKEDVGFIQKHYEDKGFYLAKVSYEISATKTDEVELHYKINDYDKVQIKKITFLNHRHFTDDQLKSALGETREGGFFSFLSGSGNFKDTAFKQDLQRLIYWYLDHGFIKFKYENPVITVSEDKKWLYISLYLDEGEPYQIKNIDFSGDLLFPKQELHQTLTLGSGELFSISKRNADIQKLSEKYQDLGYAFVNVIPKMNVNEEARTLDIEYEFEKGNLVYFGEINIVGNTKTFDKVIRRELKIQEGDLFSGTNLRQSKENVERLGFFAPGEVIFNTLTPKNKPDRVDVEISVKERSTGTVTLGAGYGSYQGFFFTTQISEINLLGRGQAVSLALQYSINILSQSLNLGFTEPYTFDSLWSSGFDIYSIKYPIPSRYTVSKLGFDVRFGHPVPGFEYTTAYFTYKHEGIQDLYPQDVSQSTIDQDTGILSSVTFSIVRDKRNNRFETTGGSYQSASIELAGLGGDMNFAKWILNNRFYIHVIGDLVFKNNIETGQITGYSGKQAPPSQRFYLGGPGNMKGYQMFMLGPQMRSPSGILQAIGGRYEAFSLFELEYPLIKAAGIKVVLFFDAGNAWDTFPLRSNSLAIRTDAGFGFRWFSPLGPLRFEWGFPFAPQAMDQSPVFQFFVGPSF